MSLLQEAQQLQDEKAQAEREKADRKKAERISEAHYLADEKLPLLSLREITGRSGYFPTGGTNSENLVTFQENSDHPLTFGVKLACDRKSRENYVSALYLRVACKTCGVERIYLDLGMGWGDDQWTRERLVERIGATMNRTVECDDCRKERNARRCAFCGRS